MSSKKIKEYRENKFNNKLNKQSHAILTKQVVYIISVLRNPMDAR